jgi:hypothetical protein
LKNPKAAKIYSLRAPHLIPIIELEQTKLEQENTKQTVDLIRPEVVKFSSQKTGKQNILSKLKDIDNEY